MGEARFANPKLQRFVAATKPRAAESLLRGLLLELWAWLLVPIGYVVMLLLGALVGLLAGGLRQQRMFAIFGVILTLVNVFVVMPLCILAIIKLVRQARRKAGRYRIDNRRRLAWDKRDPILYLRSFYDDYEDSAHRRDLKSPEEVLTFVLEDAGPIVAVGRPGEELPLLGAARIYLRDEDWQASVKYLMSVAQLVVIHGDVSEGLLWELRTARETVRPEKLLLSFLGWEGQAAENRQKLFETFKKHTDAVFGGSLPEKIGRASFILFDQGWRPIPVSVSRWWRAVFFGRTISAIRETLRPHLKRRGVRLGVRRNVIYGINVVVVALIALRAPVLPPGVPPPEGLAPAIAVYVLNFLISVPLFLPLLFIFNAALRLISYAVLRLSLSTSQK